MPLPAGLQNSHRNGGSIFLIFVADPRTARLYRTMRLWRGSGGSFDSHGWLVAAEPSVIPRVNSHDPPARSRGSPLVSGPDSVEHRLHMRVDCVLGRAYGSPRPIIKRQQASSAF